MTAVPGAARSTSGPCAPAATPRATGPIASGMTVMIHRLLAGYAVLGLLPGVPGLVAQVPAYPRPWVLAVLLTGAVLVTGMVVQAVRGRTLGAWLPAFAAYTGRIG